MLGVLDGPIAFRMFDRIRSAGIDKLIYRDGLALQDRGLNAQYIDASAHCEVIFKSKHARKSHILVTELVNLSIPAK